MSDTITVDICDGKIVGYWTVAEAAKEWNTTAVNVHQMIHRGLIDTIGVKFGPNQTAQFIKIGTKIPTDKSRKSNYSYPDGYLTIRDAAKKYNYNERSLRNRIGYRGLEPDEFVYAHPDGKGGTARAIKVSVIEEVVNAPKRTIGSYIKKLSSETYRPAGYLTVKEYADLTNMSKAQVYYRINKGAVETISVPFHDRYWRYIKAPSEC